MFRIQILVTLAAQFLLINGARILGYIPAPSYSHQVVFRPLWRELSLRGHDVTILTTSPINDPSLTNLTEIDLHFTYDQFNAQIEELIDSSENVFKSYKLYMDFFNAVIDAQLQHPSVQTLLQDRNQRFDLFLGEYIIAATFILAKKFDCPSIGITSLTGLENNYQVLGVPTHPVLYPDLLLPFEKAETIQERLHSVMYTIYVKSLAYYYADPIQNEMIAKHFGKGFSSVKELENNISLVLVNTDPIIGRIRPMVPSVIPVAGINRVPQKPLPKELKQVLDAATDGVIYFSLGTNVKSKDISGETRQILMEAFSELPYQVLWKFELDTLPNKSDNVYISKWLPQRDVLNHPHVKVFITQGGLQSVEEAIYEGIPMVGMPFYADQPVNIRKMVDKGFGLSVNHATLEKQHFKKTILEVINNPRYRNKIREVSKLAQDQPMTGLERAIWWVEYAIRHKGARHLRSAALDIPWYQYLLLDVIGLILFILTSFAYIMFLFLSCLRTLMKRAFTLRLKHKIE